MTSDIDTALGLMEWERKRKARLYYKTVEKNRTQTGYYRKRYPKIAYKLKLRRCGVSETTSENGNGFAHSL